MAIGMILLLGAAAAQAGAPPPPPLLEWPRAAGPIEVVRQPDWGDYGIYPSLARRLEQEGSVLAELLVGRDGEPRACRIRGSSGHAELDQGSCALMMEMRFKPPRDPAGGAIEASRPMRIVWVLTDPVPLAYGHLGLDLTLADGKVTDCRADGGIGRPPRSWRQTACQHLAGAAEAYFGAHKGARRARVSLAIEPDRAITTPSPPITMREITPSPWRMIGERRTSFRVNAKGDPTDCRHLVDRGIGTPREDHAGRCGLFLNGAWFDKPADPEQASATFALRVFVENR